jgi:hypothetical protein
MVGIFALFLSDFAQLAGYIFASRMLHETTQFFGVPSVGFPSNLCLSWRELARRVVRVFRGSI